MSKFVKLGVQDNIYGDALGQVELWDSSWANLSHQERANCVAKVATLSYGNEEAKKPMNLYRRLIKMGHLSVVEFIRTPHFNERGEFISDKLGLDMSLRNTQFPTWKDFDLDEETAKPIRDYTFSQVATFKIKCPLYIRSQFQRHRTFSYLELSRRYTKPSKVQFEFFRETDSLKEFNQSCQEQYLKRLENKEAPETARGSIPMDAYTEFWCSVDVDGIANFINLRADPHAQEPIRVLTQAMLTVLENNQNEMYQNAVKRSVEMKCEYKEFADTLLAEIEDL